MPHEEHLAMTKLNESLKAHGFVERYPALSGENVVISAHAVIEGQTQSIDPCDGCKLVTCGGCEHDPDNLPPTPGEGPSHYGH